VKRKYFRLPSHQFFELDTDQSYRRIRPSIIKRTKLVWKLFGPRRSMMIAGVMSADAFFEMKLSYIFGNFISTIFSAHALIEASLGSHFLMSFGKDDKIAESGFHRMITVAHERGWISESIRGRLDELRKMRIAYFHSHTLENERGALKRYMNNSQKRYMNKRTSSHTLQERDAQEALHIVHEFLREDSPDYFCDLNDLPAYAATCGTQSRRKLTARATIRRANT
jgi:hypothetical protein